MNIGDRVGLLDDMYINKYHNPWYSTSGTVGTVYGLDGLWIDVKWDNGSSNGYTYEQLFIVDGNKLLDVDELFKEIDI
jgi:hypothetical protein